jgi:hypothetical protein
VQNLFSAASALLLVGLVGALLLTPLYRRRIAEMASAAAMPPAKGKPPLRVVHSAH